MVRVRGPDNTVRVCGPEKTYTTLVTKVETKSFSIEEDTRIQNSSSTSSSTNINQNPWSLSLALKKTIKNDSQPSESLESTATTTTLSTNSSFVVPTTTHKQPTQQQYTKFNRPPKCLSVQVLSEDPKLRKKQIRAPFRRSYPLVVIASRNSSTSTISSSSINKIPRKSTHGKSVTLKPSFNKIPKKYIGGGKSVNINSRSSKKRSRSPNPTVEPYPTTTQQKITKIKIHKKRKLAHHHQSSSSNNPYSYSTENFGSSPTDEQKKISQTKIEIKITSHFKWKIQGF